MAFRNLARIKVHPDGTITGELLEFPEMNGVTLVDNGVYAVGYDDWNNKLGLEFLEKENES